MGALLADHFSVRWRGCRRVPHDEKATFMVAADDGHRRSTDGARPVDAWDGPPMEFRLAPTLLAAGEHAIELESVARGGDASVGLEVGLDGDRPAAFADGTCRR